MSRLVETHQVAYCAGADNAGHLLELLCKQNDVSSPHNQSEMTSMSFQVRYTGRRGAQPGRGHVAEGTQQRIAHVYIRRLACCGRALQCSAVDGFCTLLKQE